MSKLKEFLDNFERIYIYGIGLTAKLAYKKIYEFKKKVSGFVISDHQEIRDMDKPVYHISEWKECIDWASAGIIVAVSERYIEEIVEILEKLKISHYYVIKDELFWNETIGLMDTTIADYNHGNQIIMEAARGYILENIHNKFVVDLPCWDNFGGHALDTVKHCEYIIVGGTNLLSGDMEKECYVGITRENMKYFKNKIVLMGVGWTNEEYGWTEYSKDLFTYVLSKEYIHSVRNEYTKGKLNEIGIKNVFNTGCPTLWGITKEHCFDIPQRKAAQVLVMVNGSKVDFDIAEVVKKYYTKIYVWIQQPNDYVYVKYLYPNAQLIGRNLYDLDQFLKNIQEIDYIGTRLHGGIRCIQNKKRSIIFSTDHRARKMQEDFGLPVVDSIENLEEKIRSSFLTQIEMPFEKIERWKTQFE